MTDDGADSRAYTVRRVRAEEWRNLRDLRLEALRDPVAHLAFLERIDDALQRPDSFWRERTREAASGGAVGQFVTLDEHDGLAATLMALVTAPGEPDYIGETSTQLRAAIVGVYVRPEHRGVGVLQQLLSVAEAWLKDIGVRSVRLHVHVDNLRAQAAYRNCGYVDTGAQIDTVGGVNREMVREP